MNTIEQAREVSKELTASSDTCPMEIEAASTIDSLIEQLAQLEREMVAATLRIDNDAMELERISALADKWNFECDELREDNKRLSAELSAIKGQQPVGYIYPRENSNVPDLRAVAWPHGLPPVGAKLFLAAGAENEALKQQKPVAWIPPEREGVYRSSSFVDASREQLAGWVPLYLAAGAQP